MEPIIFIVVKEVVLAVVLFSRALACRSSGLLDEFGLGLVVSEGLFRRGLPLYEVVY